MASTKFSIGNLTEEEEKSTIMPAEHKCSACKASAFQLNKAFQHLESSRNRALKSSEILEVIESAACTDTAFDEYGLKVLASTGERVLTGPGIGEDGAGVTHGGSKWPGRIAARCIAIAGDIGEDEVYALWQEKRDTLSSKLCVEECRVAKTSRKPRGQSSERDKGKVESQPRKPKTVKAAKPLSGPKLVQQVTQSSLHKVVEAHKFVLLMLCAEPNPRCDALGTVFELDARSALGSKDVREIKFARADTSAEGNFGYVNAPVPGFLFFRSGYLRPKVYTGRYDEELDFLQWLRNEMPLYMKDDPEKFPRGVAQNERGNLEL